ncbi:MAG: tRNA pseudouridine(38-40) synthase TruA [Verrucomicrobiota bacterium]|nr:tRNA pseudouridine(38-40) synthase TruA [Verrucomicrobiota bacterium]
MPSRLRFAVAYDGAPFAGWQSQANGNAVQDHLEKAFATIACTTVRVHGAGRTDAGVHALAQIAHVDLPAKNIPAWQWVEALNGALPSTIRVLSCRYVGVKFHARFSATGKVYRYRIWNAPVLPPLEAGRAWQVQAALDFAAIVEEAKMFVGTHDFAGFAANGGQPETNTIRTIDAVRLRRSGRSITIEISGDGFLYKMVRLMVGALVRQGRGQARAGEIVERLQFPARFRTRARLVAPAAGLYLVRVRY